MVGLVLVVPVPSWPLSLAPQHHRVESLEIAHAWSAFAISVHCDGGGTFTATVLCCGDTVLPIPSWPDELSPQQYGLPPRIPHIAEVWKPELELTALHTSVPRRVGLHTGSPLP